MRKVFLVNPANATVGFSVITPRWLYVLAGATPTDLVGDPIIIDEPITPFDPLRLRPATLLASESIREIAAPVIAFCAKPKNAARP
jgi:hypothetical protein